MRLLPRLAALAGCCLLTATLSAQVVNETITLSSAPQLVFVQLTAEPTARVWARMIDPARGGTSGSRMADARGASMAQGAVVHAQQAQAIAQIRARGVSGIVLYQTEHALNGIAMQVTPQELARLRNLSDVKAIIPIELEYPTSAPPLSNGTAWVNAPKVWENSLGLPAGADGTGIRIGIIDTGLDYQHANFGGTGLLGDYQANDRTAAPDAYFPNARVVGGTDFAGDTYNGSTAPVPDADPMDCNGHGSHVAGSAAGSGVNTDGTTFAGPYTSAGLLGALRMQPGTAPKAQLYALRVFGCGGGTGLTVQAINWAMDPNGDLDLSDHLDVINMSLGSAFGSLASTTAQAADNAAAIGVAVVASAGNNGDTFFVTGSPGSGDRVVSVAASADDGMTATANRVNTPPGIAGFYGNTISATFGGVPPAGGVTGNVVQALDPADGAGPLTTDGCSPLTNAAAIAGNIAFIDRGTCGFVVKAKSAYDAGAIGVIIASNSAAAIGNMSGVDNSITIPTILITQADGNTYRTNLATLNVTLFNAGDQIASFSSRGPRGGVGGRLKPDLAAPGSNIVSTQTGVTCIGVAPSTGCQTINATGFIAGSTTLTISGTSMASPHVAGLAALVRQMHPDWSPEEIKASLMNGANKSVTTLPAGNGATIGVGRAGAGRADIAVSAVSNALAYNADDPGTVSLTFNEDFTAPATRTKRVRVQNKGTTSQTYDLSIITTNDAPGLAFSLPTGSSLTVGAAASSTLDVQLSATPSLIDHLREASVAGTQTITGTLAGLGTLARHWLTEESAVLVFSIGGIEKMRVPLYATSRPASVMSGPTSLVTGGAGSGSTTLPLSGSDVCTGTLGAGPTCIGTFNGAPFDEVSLVSPFELTIASPRDPVNAPAHADVRYFGVAYDGVNGLLNFGTSMYADWMSPTDTTVNVYIDNNEDGTWDRILFDGNVGTMGSSLFGNTTNGLDVFANALFNIATNGVSIGGAGLYVNGSPANGDNALPRNNVKILAATPAQLGLPVGDTTLRYKVVTCPGTSMLCSQINGFSYDNIPGPFFYNYGAQGLDFNNTKLAQDLNGAAIPVTWNTANMAANGSLGALLLHHHNATGNRAQAIPLDTAQAADLGVSIGAAGTLLAGSPYVFTVTVTNNGPNTSGATTIDIPLPSGLTWSSDDGGGAYDDATGLWTIPALANAASQTVTITTMVVQTGAQTLNAFVSATTPLDPNPINDSARVTVANNRSADLQLNGTTGAPTVVAGQPITINWSLKNNGVDPSYNVLFSASAIPAATITGGTPSTGVFNSGTGSWNMAGLTNGRTETLSTTLTAPNVNTSVTVTGTSSSETADPTAGNNVSPVVINVVSPSDITGTMTVSGPRFIGSTATYTLVLANASATDQMDNAGNELTLTLPSTLTLTSASASGGTALATIATNDVTWNGAIAGSSSVTITIQATVNNTAIPGASIAAQGTINYDADGVGANGNEASRATDDPGIGGAADPTAFVVSSPATLTATKTVTGQFRPGGAITYIVVVSNAGPAAQLDNAGAEFTDVLPAALTLVSASATSGTAVATIGTNTVTWNGSIANGGSVTLTIDATISNAAVSFSTISNQATLSSDADGDLSNETNGVSDDPGTGASNDPTSLTVLSPSGISANPMTLTGSRRANTNITYTLVIHNGGPAAQQDNPGHEMTDVLPATLQLVSASASAGTAVANAGTNTVDWDGVIANAADVTITIVATIKNTTPPLTSISNTAQINYDGDGNGTNESTTNSVVAFAVVSPATLSNATKSVAGTFKPSGTITYTIVLTNSGPDTQLDNAGDELVDVLPVSLNLVSATATSGTALATIPTRTVTWNGSIPAAGSVTITIEATIDPSIADGTTISNQATIHYDADGNGTNEATSVTSAPSSAPGTPTTFLAALAANIPTTSEWGLIAMAMLLALAAVAIIKR